MSRHVLFAVFDSPAAIARFRRDLADSAVSGGAFTSIVRDLGRIRASRLMPWETDAASGMAKGAVLGAVFGAAFLGLSLLTDLAPTDSAAITATLAFGAVLGAVLGALGGGLGGLATPAGALRRLRDGVRGRWVVTLSSDDASTHSELTRVVKPHAVAWSERRLWTVQEPAGPQLA